MCVLRAMQSIFEAKCDRSNKNNLSSFLILVEPAENHHSYDFFFSLNADIYVDASLFFIVVIIQNGKKRENNLFLG